MQNHAPYPCSSIWKFRMNFQSLNIYSPSEKYVHAFYFKYIHKITLSYSLKNKLCQLMKRHVSSQVSIGFQREVMVILISWLNIYLIVSHLSNTLFYLYWHWKKIFFEEQIFTMKIPTILQYCWYVCIPNSY